MKVHAKVFQLVIVLKKRENNVDFVKMDIERVESEALKHKKLLKDLTKFAICIYNNLSDYSKITPHLDNLNLKYKFYVKYYTIHAEDTAFYPIFEK